MASPARPEVRARRSAVKVPTEVNSAARCACSGQNSVKKRLLLRVTARGFALDHVEASSRQELFACCCAPLLTCLPGGAADCVWLVWQFGRGHVVVRHASMPPACHGCAGIGDRHG